MRAAGQHNAGAPSEKAAPALMACCCAHDASDESVADVLATLESTEQHSERLLVLLGRVECCSDADGSR